MGSDPYVGKIKIGIYAETWTDQRISVHHLFGGQTWLSNRGYSTVRVITLECIITPEYNAYLWSPPDKPLGSYREKKIHVYWTEHRTYTESVNCLSQLYWTSMSEQLLHSSMTSLTSYELHSNILIILLDGIWTQDLVGGALTFPHFLLLHYWSLHSNNFFNQYIPKSLRPWFCLRHGLSRLICHWTGHSSCQLGPCHVKFKEIPYCYIEFHPEHSPMFSDVLRSHVTSFHTFHPNSPLWNINTLQSP